MKNPVIRDAWNTVNPTPDQRSRMRAALEAQMGVSSPEKKKKTDAPKVIEFEDLSALDFELPEVNYNPPQPKKEEAPKKNAKPQPRYSAQNAPKKKKSDFAAVAALTAAVLTLVLVSSLLLIRLRGRNPENPAFAAPAETVKDPSAVILRPDIVSTPDTGNSKYNGVLQKYVDAINQNWSEERYLEAGISAHIYDDNAQEALGWCLMDLDGNGQEELLISDGETLYDGYTIMENGDVTRFLTSNDNDQYQLCMDGIIYGFAAADGKTFWTYRKLEDGFVLQPVKTVVYDSQANTYYAGQTETSAQPISKDEAGEIIVSLYPRVTIPVTLFKAGEDELPVEYQPLIDKYISAIQEDWDGERCSMEDISILVRDVPTLDDLGYAQMDLDGDGFTELIITDGNVIYDLYTRFQSTDRLLTHVITGHERNIYYLCNNGILANEGYGGAATGEHRFSRLEEGTEYLIERLEYEYTLDANQQPVATWIHYGPGDLINQVTVTEVIANEIIDSYTHVFIPHTTFAGEKRNSEYPATSEQLIRYAEKIPEAFVDYGKAEEKTFCFHDIDDDGMEELLLGGGNSIYRILQPKRGSGEEINVSSLVGNSGYAYLCEGNVVQCMAFAQGNNHYEFIKLTDPDGSAANEVEVVDYIFYSPETESWYEGGPGINTPIFDEDAEAVFDAYPQVNLNWKPISEFPVPIGETGVVGTPLFEEVFMPVATGEVSNRLEDVTALVEKLGFSWTMDEGVLECIDHNAAHGTLIAYLTNVNGYEEVFDLTYVNKYGENEEDCRKATVAMLEGEDVAYYIGTDTIIYVGAEIEDPDDFRKFVFGHDDSLMLKVLTTQFAVAYFSHDEIYLEDAMSSDCTQRDIYTGGFTSFRDFGEIRGLPLEESWDGTSVCLSLPFIDSEDTDSYTYLTLEFVKENGFWKVSFYGLEK